MPCLDLRNVIREHSPFIWPRLHARAFDRYVGVERIRALDTIALYIAVTRLRDRAPLFVDLRSSKDPFQILLASNYLPPFYTHPPKIDGEAYGDGSLTNNIPYEALLDRGCDQVVLITAKGESEGGLHRNIDDCEHIIPKEYADRVIIIRPRHRLPLGFVERRWEKLVPIANLGALRTREVLLGERHAECDLAAPGKAPSFYFSKARHWIVKTSRRSV